MKSKRAKLRRSQRRKAQAKEKLQLRWAQEVIPSGISPLVQEPVSEKKKLKRYALSILFMCLILFFTFKFLLKDTSGTEIYESLANTNGYYLALAFLQMLLSQVCSALSLIVLMHFLFGIRLPWRFGHNTAYIGFYFNNITPSASGGQPMQIYYLYRCGLKVADGSALLVLISLYYNTLMIVMGLVCLFWRYDLFARTLGRLSYILTISLLVNGGLMLLYILVISRPILLKRWTNKILDLLLRWGWVRGEHRLRAVIDGFFKSYSQVSQYLKGQRLMHVLLILINILQNAFYFNVPYFVGRALGAHGPFFFTSFATQAVLTLTSSGFPTPGAVGITETAFLQLYEGVLPPEKVMTAMILTRTVNLYVLLIVSTAIVLYAFLRAGRGRYRMDLPPEHTCGLFLNADEAARAREAGEVHETVTELDAEAKS